MNFRLIKLASFTLISIQTTFCLQSVHAEFVPGWDRPLKRAEMKIIQNKFGHNSAERRLILTLTRQDGATGMTPTGIVVELQNPQTQEVSTERLVIQHVQVDPCGSIEYDANIPEINPKAEESCRTSVRLSVHLADHSQRICLNTNSERKLPHWEAQIGTPDSYFTASGAPEDVVTIQDLQP